MASNCISDIFFPTTLLKTRMALREKLISLGRSVICILRKQGFKAPQIKESLSNKNNNNNRIKMVKWAVMLWLQTVCFSAKLGSCAWKWQVKYSKGIFKNCKRTGNSKPNKIVSFSLMFHTVEQLLYFDIVG